MKTAATLVLISILSFNIAAIAADGEKIPTDTFEIFDKNGDGVITRYEGPKTFKWRPGLFEAEDLNHDARITRFEFAEWRKTRGTDELLRQVGAQN